MFCKIFLHNDMLMVTLNWYTNYLNQGDFLNQLNYTNTLLPPVDNWTSEERSLCDQLHLLANPDKSFGEG